MVSLDLSRQDQVDMEFRLAESRGKELMTHRAFGAMPWIPLGPLGPLLETKIERKYEDSKPSKKGHTGS